MKYNFRETDDRPAGYLYFVQEVKTRCIPHWHQSYVSTKRIRKIEAHDKHHIIETYPATLWPGEQACKQLEFALKHDGIHLGMLHAIFKQIDIEDLCHYIQGKPRSIYARRLWFLYEFLLGEILPIPDLSTGQYIPVLDHELYYTLPTADKVKRQRIFNNLLGPASFCPIVRRPLEEPPLPIQDIIAQCKDEVTQFELTEQLRAQQYLYLKETKSSFDIEHESITVNRGERFVQALRLAETQDFCNKEGLIQLQAEMLDLRFASSTYRSSQNYVGEARGFKDSYQPYIHYISPKPEDLAALMDGLITSHQNIIASKKAVKEELAEKLLPSYVHAALVAYSFVFLHPFEDGNGRTHRFLIHNILSLSKLIPEGFIFPISATLKKYSELYNQSLEAFSVHSKECIRYDIDSHGQLRVGNDSKHLYQYLDLSYQAEMLGEFIRLTAEEEFITELHYIRNYDKAQRAIRDIVDLPDKRIDLIIKLCFENKGHLSKAKRKRFFAELNDTEIQLIEEGFAEFFKNC